MTTSTFTSPVDSDTDADFRAWGSQLSAQLQAVGLVQTADTGQIDWSTVSISGYPGSVGYEIYEFSASDPFQASTPIFIKLEYGASGAEQPELWVTLGAGSDGAGNLTGGANASNYKSGRIGNYVGSPTFGAAYPTYICHNPALGFFGLAFKMGSSYGSSSQGNYGGGGLFINRTNDTSGAPTADGWTAYVLQAGNPTTCYWYFQNPSQPFQLPSAGNQYGTQGYFGCIPGNLTSSYAGGSLQVVPVSQWQPAVQVNANLCIGQLSEIPVGNQFSLNIVGLTARNYISVGSPCGGLVASASYTYDTTCMLWQ